MEKSINRKIAEHANLFKKTIATQIANLNIDKNTKTDLLRLVYDYNVLTISKNDMCWIY